MYSTLLLSTALTSAKPKVPSSGAGRNAATVGMIMAMDWAKMMGRTPDIFTFMGRVEF